MNEPEENTADGKPEVFITEREDGIQWVASTPLRKKGKTKTAVIRSGSAKNKGTAKIDSLKAIEESCKEAGIEEQEATITELSEKKSENS